VEDAHFADKAVIFVFSADARGISEMSQAGCLEDCLACDLEDFDFPHLDIK
jgi:hypothetical protein